MPAVSDKRVLMEAGSLMGFCRQVFVKLGVSEEDSKIAAAVLVAADLRGIESHGIARLRAFYVNRLRSGDMTPSPRVEVVRDTPVSGVMDGGNGLGHPIAHRAMNAAIEKARRMGAGFVTVRNSNHFGIAGYYAMMALERDCIGMCMTSTNPWVVPTFGAEAVLGTNPIAVAVPCGQEPAFVLDMATSAVPIGKLEVFDRLGLPIPPHWGTDARGVPTTDADAVLRTVKAGHGGGLVPLGGVGEETGGHKGYGLSVWGDIFSVLLAGGPLADTTQHPESGQTRRMGSVCHFFGAWHVDAFRPLTEFKTDMDRMLQRLKSSRKAEGQARIYVAGEKEYGETESRLRDGIPLPDTVVDDLHALASEFGVELNVSTTKQNKRRQ